MRYDKQKRRAEKTEKELVASGEKLKKLLDESRVDLQKLNLSHTHLQSVVESLMHESRRFSSAISSYAEELGRKSAEITDSRIKDLADTIFYTSGLLSSRMAFSDFELNPQSISRQSLLRTGIYKKFDKTRYILSKQARQKEVEIKFIGNSLLEIDALQAFELVPFVLLENAVKYSPPKQDVSVTFTEGVKNKELDVIISSLGPQLLDEEYSRLFSRGMRGASAVSSSVSGEGLGLYLAKSLCDLTNISISVASPSTSSFALNSIYYSPFTIQLRVKR